MDKTLQIKKLRNKIKLLSVKHGLDERIVENIFNSQFKFVAHIVHNKIKEHDKIKGVYLPNIGTFEPRKYAQCPCNYSFTDIKRIPIKDNVRCRYCMHCKDILCEYHGKGNVVDYYPEIQSKYNNMTKEEIEQYQQDRAKGFNEAFKVDNND